MYTLYKMKKDPNFAYEILPEQKQKFENKLSKKGPREQVVSYPDKNDYLKYE